MEGWMDGWVGRYQEEMRKSNYLRRKHDGLKLISWESYWING